MRKGRHRRDRDQLLITVFMKPHQAPYGYTFVGAMGPAAQTSGWWPGAAGWGCTEGPLGLGCLETSLSLGDP